MTTETSQPDLETLLDREAWTQRLEKLIEAHHTPGAALAVARLRSDGDPAEVMVVTAGVTHNVTGTPVGADTLFQIGSHTKIWTTTLLMQLVDEGLLDLDAPVADVLPGLRLPGTGEDTRFTTRHLLTHQAGLDGDGITNWEMDDGALGHFVEQLGDARRSHEVGELWSYSNNAFSLAGHIAAVLRRTTWERALRTHLFEPLGLTHTATDAEEAILQSPAIGHLPDQGDTLSPTPRWGIPRKDNPAGGLAISVAEVTEFMLMHLRDGVGSNGVRVLSEASARAMRHPELLPSAEVPMGNLTGQGLGWHLTDWGETKTFGHDGGTFGQYCHLLAVPEHGLVVAVTTNGGDILPLFRAVDDELKHALGLAVEHPVIPPQDPAPEFDREVLGVYDREAIRCRLFEEDGVLRLGVTMRGPLHAVTSRGAEEREEISQLSILGPRRFALGDADHLTQIVFLRTARDNDYLWMDVAVPRVSD